jgi:hypothetical protein
MGEGIIDVAFVAEDRQRQRADEVARLEVGAVDGVGIGSPG